LLLAFLLLLNFLITGPEAAKLPEGRLGWSFGLTFLCIISESVIGVAIFLERRHYLNLNKDLKTKHVTKARDIRSLDRGVVHELPDPDPKDDQSYSYRSSTASLSLPSGSYYHIPDSLSVDTVSTDIVHYNEEPGTSKRGQMEWEV
jgi:hypothetical protein